MPKDAAPDTMPELAATTLFDVSGKVGLVTGGGSGIGKSELLCGRDTSLLSAHSTNCISIPFDFQ